MDKFVQDTETDVCTGQPILFGEPGLVMDYYDATRLPGCGTTPKLRDERQQLDTTFGPSTRARST